MARIVPDENGWMSKFPTDFGVPRDDNLPYSIISPPRGKWPAHRFNFATVDECGAFLAEMLTSWANGGLECECGEQDCFEGWVRVMPIAEVKDSPDDFVLLKLFVSEMLPTITEMIAIKRGIDPREFWDRCSAIEDEFLAELAIFDRFPTGNAPPINPEVESASAEAERVLSGLEYPTDPRTDLKL